MLDSWLSDNKTLIKTYAITPAIINYLLNTSNTNTNLQLRNTLEKFESINRFSLNIGVTDTNGIILDNGKNVSIGENIQNTRPGLLTNIQNNNDDVAFDSKIVKSTADNKWSLGIISGVRDYNNNLIGYIYMTLNWEELILKLKELKLDETGRLFALDSEGSIVIDTFDYINENGGGYYQLIKKNNKPQGVINYKSKTASRTAVFINFSPANIVASAVVSSTAAFGLSSDIRTFSPPDAQISGLTL